MLERSFEEDDDRFDSKRDKRKFISDRGELNEVVESVSPIKRVAARALAFNLRYIMERMDSGL